MKLFIFKPAYIFFPIALFSFFYFNENLFINFISTAVILLSVYFTIITIFTNFISRKKEISLRLSNGSGILQINKNNISVSINGFNDNIPGYEYYLEFDMYEDKKLLNNSRVQIHPDGTDLFNMDMVFERHGIFSLKNIKLVITDIFHFTEVNIKTESVLQLIVKPFLHEYQLEKLTLETGGTQSIQSTIRLNSSDLFDIRKYYPGDDMRKINWKVFAHTGELHIRELEKIPPDVGEIGIIFAPYSVDNKEYELTSALFYSAVNKLLDYNITLRIFSPSAKRSVIITKDDTERLDSILYSSYCKYENTEKITENHTLSLGFLSAEEFLHMDTEKQFSEEALITVCDAGFHKQTLQNIFLKIITADSFIKDIKYNLQLSKEKTKLESDIKDKIEQSKKKITLVRL